MKSVKGAQYLSPTSLSLLFRFAGGGGTGTVIVVPLTSIYVSL